MKILLIFGSILALTVATKNDTSVSGETSNLTTFVSHLEYKNLVENLFPLLNKCRMEKFIQDFTSFYSRHAYLDYGPGSAEDWLRHEIGKVVLSAYNTTFSEVPGHMLSYSQQESFIAKVEGYDPVLKSEVVILGAHHDSLNRVKCNAKAPGADDNASGCSVVIELLKVILESQIKFRRTIEFHWYGKEELGLIGSKDVVWKYKNEQVKVKGMLNLDSIGIQTPEYGKSIRIVEDWTDESLTSFVKLLAENYLGDYNYSTFNYYNMCSDHASWYAEGFPAAFVTSEEHEELEIHHTENDTIDNLNFEQIHEVAKVALAFIIELAEPFDVPTQKVRFTQRTDFQCGSASLSLKIGIVNAVMISVCIYTVHFYKKFIFV